MDFNETANLISQTFTQDAIGQEIATETSRTVYVNSKSITQQEFYEAGRSGISPQYKLTLFAYDYNDETIVEYKNKRYVIYRTFQPNTDTIELYLERRNGIGN